MGNRQQEGNFSCSQPFNVSIINILAQVTGLSASQELAVPLQGGSILNDHPASCIEYTTIGSICSRQFFRETIMSPGFTILVAALSYLFGSISFARLISRFLDPSVELENVHLPAADGSQGQRLKNVGATTASVKYGPRVGCTIGLLDILKGVVPVLVLRLLFPGSYYYLIAAVFVVVGHNWPVYYRFKGGGGISPTYGGFFVVDFPGTVVSAFAGLVFGFFIVRDIMIAYMSGLWFFLLWMIAFKADWAYILYGIVMNIIFMLATLPEAMEYFRKKRAGQVDMKASMETFPMGRGMLKIMKFFGTEPRRKTE